MNICPECLTGKHRNCDGTAWDFITDQHTACHCAAEEHELTAQEERR